MATKYKIAKDTLYAFLKTIFILNQLLNASTFFLNYFSFKY